MFDTEKFGLYVSKMRAAVAMKGFGKALDMKFKTKLPAKEDDVLRESNAGKKAQTKAKVTNAIDVHYLMFLMEEEERMGIIAGSFTDDLSSVLACEIWNALEEENISNDTLAKEKLIKKSTSCSLVKWV